MVKRIKGRLIIGAVGVLALVAIMMGIFVLPRNASAAAAHPQTHVTQQDAEQLFRLFFPLCGTTFQPTQDAHLCAIFPRGRITPVQNGKGYCVTDWHLISTLFIDTPANLNVLRFHFMLDGKDLPTHQTPITQIDPAFSQQFYGGQFDWIQNGTVIRAGALKVGNHTLHLQIFDATGLTTDTTISFQIFPVGSSTCK